MNNHKRRANYLEKSKLTIAWLIIIKARSLDYIIIYYLLDRKGYT